MTRLVAKAVMWLALAAVIVVAGGHFVYYLYGWEWGRAGIAGTGFTAALILGSTFLFLGRIQRIERRLDQILLAQQATASAGEPAGPPDIEPRPDFPWLTTTRPQLLGILALVAYDPPRPSVFIPVFLAAGLAISATAGVVERVAALRYREGPAAGTGAARQAASAGAPPTAREVIAAQPRRWLVVFPVVGIIITGLVVGGLYVISHYWSKPIGPGVTTMTVEVSSRGPTYPAIEVVESVGRYCSVNTGTGVRYLGVAPGPGESTLLRLAPLLDEDAQDRFVGCVEDAVLEWHRLDVTGTTLDPR
jgi:hypothetical protein